MKKVYSISFQSEWTIYYFHDDSYVCTYKYYYFMNMYVRMEVHEYTRVSINNIYVTYEVPLFSMF